MNSKSFKPRYYNNASVGSLLVIVAFIVMPFTKGNTSNRLMIGGIFAVIGILMIFQALYTRLVFTEDAIKVTSLFPKKVRYSDITKIGWGKIDYKGGSGYGNASCINVTSQQGKRLKIMPIRFSGYEGNEGWAALILKIISEHGISTDNGIVQRLNDVSTRSTSVPPRYV